jgi:hypothetical protein
MFEYGVLLVCDHLPRNLGVKCMMFASCHLALHSRDVDDDQTPMFVVIDWNHNVIYEKQIHTMIPYMHSYKICIIFLTLNEFEVDKIVEDVES